MATIVKAKNGKKVTLLNPSEKAKKFSIELKQKQKRTNDNKLKTDKNGKAVKLSGNEASYRMGYLAARKDSAACYNASKGSKSTRSSIKK